MSNLPLDPLQTLSQLQDAGKAHEAVLLFLSKWMEFSQVHHTAGNRTKTKQNINKVNFFAFTSQNNLQVF